VIGDDVQDAIVELVRQHVDDGVRRVDLSWFGGEPLLAVDAIVSISHRLIKVCGERGAEYVGNITTNGFPLRDDVIDRLRTGHIGFLKISLDGPLHIHDKRRVALRGGAGLGRLVRVSSAIVEQNAAIEGHYTHYSTRQSFAEAQHRLLVAAEQVGLAHLSKCTSGTVMPLCLGGWSRERLYLGEPQCQPCTFNLADRVRSYIDHWCRGAGAPEDAAGLRAANARLQELLVERDERIAGQDAETDGPAKPAPRSLRGRSGRKPGRPKGQPGATMQLPHSPCWTARLGAAAPTCCNDGGDDLTLVGYSSRGSPALSNRSISDGRFVYRVRSSRTRAVNAAMSSSRRAFSCRSRRSCVAWSYSFGLENMVSFSTCCHVSSLRPASFSR
jgi:hypothetical protein